MKKSSIALIIVLAFVMAGPLYTPTHGSGVNGLAAPTSGTSLSSSVAPLVRVATPLAPAPMTTYPRTVLIETFTAEWCFYCEEESQAMYQIEHNTNRTFLDIAELHVCYSVADCGDNYGPADGTATARVNYYEVTGFPTVFFDGSGEIIGAGGTVSTLEASYQNAIDNASYAPGNVSIAQSASVTGSTVTSYANITSAITGSYHAITYLVEFIGKNDSTGHDIGYVVRRSLVDQTVALTAGSTTEISGTGAIGSGWNFQHLSVVTLIQDNATKVIENANMAPVTTLNTAVSGAPTTIPAGNSSTITVRVLNSSTGAALSGAAVTLTSSGGGSLSPASGVTASNGTFSSVFTAPMVTSTETFVITAEVSATGYTAGSGSANVVVNPVVAPSVPTDLSLTIFNQQVDLRWTAPSSGGGGVTYHVYRSTTETGGYAQVGTATMTAYVDTGLVSGQSYWYTVSAQNTGGFSANTSAAAANAVLVESQGLPPSIGWWISIDSMVLSSSTNASLSFHLPDGFYAYQYGPNTYGYLAPQPFGNLTVAGAPVQLTAGFSLRFATLQGTVTPYNANVTVNGTALAVVGGSFFETLAAGTYALKVTSSGYEPNSTTVTLTPGNITTKNFKLTQVPSTTGTSTLGGMSMEDVGALGVIAAAIVIAAVFGVLMLSKRKKGDHQPPVGSKAPTSSSGTPPQRP
jgi:hypothetical protein